MKDLLRTFIVAIDGPNSSGKSSLAKELAKRLNITYIDTGAMYRALGYYFLEKGYEMTDESARLHMKEPKLEFGFKDGKTAVILDSKDISIDIRTPEIAMAASNISKLLPVREYLVQLQRDMSKSKSVVMEGRDIGTVVFPNAEVKIYLTADIKTRALRRKEDYKKIGKEIALDEVIAEIEKRDKQDMERENSPLKVAEDAVVFDNSEMSFEETVEKALEIINEKVN
ncbi:MAG: (d)CMP kinase [Clostridia bacterium]|nr:(d)CMP kinase [Clostridia bacterium]